MAVRTVSPPADGEHHDPADKHEDGESGDRERDDSRVSQRCAAWKVGRTPSAR